MVFLPTLAWLAGCVAASEEPGIVALGEAFRLKVGESVRIEAEVLQVGFDDVSADSRCPKGEQCLREGEATVRVSLREAAAPKEVVELHISSQDEGALTWRGYELKLLRLDPYPMSGKAIPRGDYVATLEVARVTSTSALPDR
ncbi:MAG TPA: hypothetical protein VI669_00250 [Vicinamibacteria bacterium]